MENLSDLLFSRNDGPSGWRIKDDRGEYTREDFKALALDAAKALAQLEVSQGDRVVLYGRNSAHLAAAMLGAQSLGAVASPVNPDTGASRFRYIYSDTGAKAVIADEDSFKKLKSLALPMRVLAVEKMLPQKIGRRKPQAQAPANPNLAAIIYTSGSTGVPLGVMVGHSQALTAVKAINAVLGTTAEDTILAGLPFSFDYGLYQLYLALEGGCRLVIKPGFPMPLSVPQLLHREDISMFPAVPSLLAALLKSRLLERIKLPALRMITSTGDVLPAEHEKAVRKVLPDAAVVRMYGLTECKRVSIMPPERSSEKEGSVGLPLPGTRVWLERKKGEMAGPGEVGELVVEGPHVMDGYWNDPKSTALKFGPGEGEARTLRTGDLFRIDEEGFLYFVARKGKMIKTREHRISPLEIENFLHTLPGVQEAAVIGIPDGNLGHQAAAALSVSRQCPLTEAKVKKLCAANLAPGMVPHRVYITPSQLPKTFHGKINRKVLRSRFEDN